MRKLYGFLLALVLFGALSSEVARAQTYAMTDYVVRKVDVPDAQNLGSGTNWQPLASGTPITSGYVGTYQGYLGYYTSTGMQMPFNVRFLNQQITTATTFSITTNGDVILSPTWGATWQYYAYCGYCYNYGYFYGLNNSSNYVYEYDYGLYNNEQNGGSYGYYANYCLMPFSGYMYNYIPYFTANIPYFKYAILGSAPNREWVVEAGNQHPYEESFYDASGPNFGSWQTVIYENAISAFQFNYGPTVGNPRNGPDTHNYSSVPVSYNGWVWPGSWDYAYIYNAGSYLYAGSLYSAICGIKAAGGQAITVDWNGNGWDATRNFVTQTNTYYGSYRQGGAFMPDTARYLPRSSIKFMIAYNYDFTAGTITNPGDQAIKNLNSTQAPTVKITNSGRLQPTQIQVLFQVSLLGQTAPVYSQTLTLTGAQVPAGFGSSTVTFPSFVVPSYGIYYDTVIIYGLSPTADQNPADNTSTNTWTCSPPDNIKATTILSPAPGSRTPIAVSTPVSVRFQNIGSNDQFNIPLTAVIKDPSGAVVYRDTLIAPYIPSPNTSIPKSTLDTAFKDWIPQINGKHQICGIAIMSSDQLRADDTTCTISSVLYESDAEANSIVIPQPDQEMPYTLRWQPSALFRSAGVADLFDVPVRVQIRRCTDNALVFQSDSIMPELNVDQNLVRFYFPAVQGSSDIARLSPGCYNICAIAKYPTDGDRSNDTACSTFSIIDRLKGNIYVGVGQRFQSVHAAVDSMRFRGIGGNLNLILTDANYTENGNYLVSSNYGALDMRGIRGLSDTSRVVWMPKPGVTPTITFNGNKPYCFYFGDLFGGYMSFMGYNPLGVPLPDKFVGEAFKRGITIIDNSTVAGGVFGIEQGASNLTFKDLRLFGNGAKTNSNPAGGSMYANDSSQVIHIWNEQNRQIYLAGVRDTIPIHNIRVENCEIGNAKYGIYDHGLKDLFDLGASAFKERRNIGNVFTRNTIGSPTNRLSFAGILFNSEKNLVISHNEISNVDDSLTKISGTFIANAYGIMEPDLTVDSTGNVIGIQVDANRIHNIRAFQGNAYGVLFTQGSTIYTVAGTPPILSSLPVVTANRVSNNMIFDLRGKVTTYPIIFTTGTSTYTTDRDSIFNNTISTTGSAVNITVKNSRHAFLWNNIIQNLGANGSYTNYSLQLPRPFASSITSDYNLFDLRNPLSPGVSTFATVSEYDARPTSGTILQTRTFRKLADWRSYVQQDQHSVTGDPRFALDSAHLPDAFSYISSPASNNGAWLGTATQLRDFDGDMRLQGNATPDIGADEFEGFQYSNDLAVLSINQPNGYSQTSDTSLATVENPLWVSATVKNLSAQSVFNRTVMATVEVAISNGPWQTIYSGQSASMTWDVNESKNVSLAGPTITPAQAKNGVFRMTMWVATDQNHVNDSLSKVFKVLLKSNATVVTYNGATAAGRKNRDSVYLALANLGFNKYDTLDRNFYGATDLDYSPWWTIIYVSGDPNVPVVAGQPTGQSGLSFKETEEMEKYLKSGVSYAKKSVIMAGQNIAFQNGFAKPNNNVTDTEFFNSYMHTKYVANSPVSGAYSGLITGMQTDYWNFKDQINSTSPDVVKPAVITPLVGPEVNWFAYTYNSHALTPADSGAATTYYNPLINTVFFAFDWSDATHTAPYPTTTDRALYSGVTRVMRGALDFIQSHAGTILPVEFVSATGTRSITGTSAQLNWETAQQHDVARFDVEMHTGATWTNVGSVSASKYSFTHDGIDASATYVYRIVAVDQSGAKTYSTEINVAPLAASGYSIEQNYPNPTSGVTSVRFTLPVDAPSVTLRILDVTGKVVTTAFANKPMSAGNQSETLDVTELPSGSYIYELTAVDGNGQAVTLSKKMTLNK